MESMSREMKQMRSDNTDIKLEIRENIRIMQERMEMQQEDIKLLRGELDQTKTD